MSPVGTDIRILVVDDHAMTREMVRHILKGLGYSNVVTAESGPDALNLLKATVVGLVVCDWNMPSMSGLELLRAVRKESRYEHLPFIMLTAEAYRENIAEAAYAGVTDYIAKPFTADVLGEKVRLALSRKRTGN